MSQNPTGFLPISKEDMIARGWYYCDFLLVTGDAYLDHPSFGTAVISRVLEDAGFRVAILSQPDFRSEADFLAMGRPRYAVLINSGNIWRGRKYSNFRNGSNKSNKCLWRNKISDGAYD